MTANHCIGTDDTIGGQISWLIFKNADVDIAILQSPGMSEPAFRPAHYAGHRKQPAFSLGFPLGLPEHITKSGIIAHGAAQVPDFPKRVLLLDFRVLPGMSGGPILNTAGDVISINQRGGAGCDCGYGLPIRTLYDLTAQFWEFKR
jgi:S1-C subfamily serine protease